MKLDIYFIVSWIPTFKLSKKQLMTGFTLIELVVVILLLGILALTVIPKFSNLSDESEIATVRGIAAALQSGVNIVKTTFKTKGYQTRVQNLPDFGAGNIDTNNIGFPIGIDKGNGNENIGRGNNGCIGVWNGVLDNPPTVASNNNNQQFRSYRHTGNRVCSYVYRENGDTGNQNTGQVVIKYDSRDGSVVVCGTSVELPGC